MSKDLSIVVNGIEFENPFVIGSGPPGTNKTTIMKAFNEGWGGVVAKTISLDASKVHNVAPRYGKLYSRVNNEVIGFQNIELISDRSVDDWMKDFREIKKECPKGVLIASIMEEYNKENWQTLVKMCQDNGADAFELNFSCPHGLPERKMGAAMGENPDIVAEVTEWVTSAAKIPVWAKMTPNVTDVNVPAFKAIESGAHGISLINTILAIIGVDLNTLRPMPTVKGYSTPGGYSAQAVRPIALRHVMKLAKALQDGKYKDISISGMGGVERASDAIEFMLLGSHTVQSCTGPMLQGYKMVHELKSGLEAFMTQHKFNKVSDFVGHSLQYFTTHAHLNELKQGKFEGKEVSKDAQWSGDEIAKQTNDMASN
ncbi:MAG: NAD-dependent dihydropyrimidine dehydrogenase subunit PreA [Bacteriovoracaceae bacterium]|nr:NAD-dependent dihydropyrimidine dehydrogenase subunit PreA [Bacteriovoracaceae bacterium]